jgi:NIMA (never in mitosis gene a)-related kinase
MKDGRVMTNLGTVGYTAPEVIINKTGYSFPADIWSLGIVIYELLVG